MHKYMDQLWLNCWNGGLMYVQMHGGNELISEEINE